MQEYFLMLHKNQHSLLVREVFSLVTIDFPLVEIYPSQEKFVSLLS